MSNIYVNVHIVLTKGNVHKTISIARTNVRSYTSSYRPVIRLLKSGVRAICECTVRWFRTIKYKKNIKIIICEKVQFPAKGVLDRTPDTPSPCDGPELFMLQKSSTFLWA